MPEMNVLLAEVEEALFLAAWFVLPGVW